MNLKKLSIFSLALALFAACGPGANNNGTDTNRDNDMSDTTYFDERPMQQDSVYPLDTATMQTDTM